MKGRLTISKIFVSPYSWHLHQVLQAIGFKHLPEIHSGHLNTSYAAQLEAMGLWHWAIFVLMHIQDPQR